MSGLLNAFFFGFGIYLLVVAWTVDSDLSGSGCINVDIRNSLKLLLVSSSILMTLGFSYFSCESTCYARCATFEGKEKKSKDEPSVGNAIFSLNSLILVLNVFICSILGILLKNTVNECNISVTSRNLLWGGFGVSLSLSIVSLVIMIYRIRQGNIAGKAKAASKGLTP